MSMRILVPLAEGFEEIEAINVIDILRRADIEVVIAGLKDGLVEGAHKVRVMPDTTMNRIDGKDFDGYIGDKVRKKIGLKKWNRRVAWMLPYFHTLLHYDHLYIGGGNSRRLDIELPCKTTVVPNVAGLKGGAALWRNQK